MTDVRKRTREVALRSIASGDRTAWFEEIYAAAAGDPSRIPWADMTPNPNLVGWAKSRGGRETVTRLKKQSEAPRALVVGAGLGDDAEHLSSLGFTVVACDVAPAAIGWCKERFPGSSVDYTVADLLAPPAGWERSFPFVFEAYTLQSLPRTRRADAFDRVASFVAPGGALLVVAMGRDEREQVDGPPWPLAASELERFESAGLELVRFEDYADDERPPKRRFRAEYARPPSSAS